MDIDDIFDDFDDVPELFDVPTMSAENDSIVTDDNGVADNAVLDNLVSDQEIGNKKLRQSVMQKIEIYFEEKDFLSNTFDVFDG